MEEQLKLLADKLGIATQFSDAGLVRREYDVSEDVVKFLVRQLGYNASSPKDIDKSLQSFERRRWQRTLESIYVVGQDDIRFDAVIPAAAAGGEFGLIVCPEGKACANFGEISFEVVNTGEKKKIGKTDYVLLNITVTSALDPGYYDVSFKVNDKIYTSYMAIAPRKCFENEALKEGKIWGFTVQLYSLRSNRNWGVGDFSDLAELVRIGARSGADVIGLNPLNVLNHSFPEDASPYSSLSRLFMNPIYIDVENVPEFTEEDRAVFEPEAEKLRQTELIHYAEVYRLKIKALELLHKRFKFTSDKERRKEYEAYCREKGADLEKMAVFQTLYEEKCGGTWCGGWRSWEKEFQNPYSEAVRKYEISHKERIDFFKFLQFEAERQFKQASGIVAESGMRMGFYRDLPVGVSSDSIEVWSEPDLFLPDAGAGAPPDAFFPNGQKWGLGTFNPYVLKEKRYGPFIRILRANMHFAGALRIDHVMGLMRLYVIPNSRNEGTYLRFNFKDMLNIVALESYLNKCTIVGESIGNVPEGFLETLSDKDIYSLSVLWAERENAGWGDFRAPEAYPEFAFTSVGTHDMTPLRMWWFAYDLQLMRSLSIIPDDNELHQAYHKRENDRLMLLNALDRAGVWPEDNMRTGNYLYGEKYPEGIEEAVHGFVAKSKSKVFLAQLEDILHVEKLQNLPGVDRDKHPNWRRKMPVALENLEADIAYIRNIRAIKRER